MHSIELERAQVQQLVDHCAKHHILTWFIAKDHGAYVGASCGSEPEQQCLFFFKGCDPKKDKDFYDNAEAKFGGDDFGENLPIADLQRYLAVPNMVSVRIKVTSKSITMDVMESVPAQPAPKPEPVKVTVNEASNAKYYGIRKPSGKVVCFEKDKIDSLILEICGGGQTAQQTAKAMATGAELREKGRVTIKGYKIGPLSEV